MPIDCNGNVIYGPSKDNPPHNQDFKFDTSYISPQKKVIQCYTQDEIDQQMASLIDLIKVQDLYINWLEMNIAGGLDGKLEGEELQNKIKNIKIKSKI